MKTELLKNLPSVDAILRNESSKFDLGGYPRDMVVNCIRQTLDELCENILNDQTGRCGAMHVSTEAITNRDAEKLRLKTKPSIRRRLPCYGFWR